MMRTSHLNFKFRAQTCTVCQYVNVCQYVKYSGESLDLMNTAFFDCGGRQQ